MTMKKYRSQLALTYLGESVLSQAVTCQWSIVTFSSPGEFKFSAALLQSASQKFVTTAKVFESTLKRRTKTVMYQLQARQYASITANVILPFSVFSSDMSIFCLSSLAALSVSSYDSCLSVALELLSVCSRATNICQQVRDLYKGLSLHWWFLS